MDSIPSYPTSGYSLGRLAVQKPQAPALREATVRIVFTSVTSHFNNPGIGLCESSTFLQRYPPQYSRSFVDI